MKKVLLFYYHLLLIILVLVLLNAQNNDDDEREDEKLDEPNMNRRDGITVVQKHRKQHDENIIAHNKSLLNSPTLLECKGLF